MQSMNAHDLADVLRQALGAGWSIEPLGASHFCGTWRAQRRSDRLFVKSATAATAALLEAEADGLAALHAAGTIRVPQVACLAGHGDARLLAMEWLDLSAPDAGFGARLGAAVGELHARAAPLATFGWPRDNFIGATPQVNTPATRWVDFFGERRLRAMADRLPGPRGLHSAVSQVIALLPALFEDGPLPRPSLIHGDLWAGNWGMLADGTPVIYDPAVSCSDAQAELAMMELFGAPPAGFWPAYRAAAGLDAGYARRRPVYQLYHLLNHAVLFGGGYLQQSLRLARSISGRSGAA